MSKLNPKPKAGIPAKTQECAFPIEMIRTIRCASNSLEICHRKQRYSARYATNLPDWKERGLVFTSNGLLLASEDYVIVRECFPKPPPLESRLVIDGKICHHTLTIRKMNRAIVRRMTTLANPGFCIVCGRNYKDCEPDTQARLCTNKKCNKLTVYAPEEILLRIY